MKFAARNRFRRRTHGGFTLMEVLLVLAILVIMGSLVVMNFGNILGKAKVKSALNQLNAFKGPIDAYMLDVGTYPTTQQGLTALRTLPPDLVSPNKWVGPYLNGDIPLDPWDNPYVYEQLNAQQYRMYSMGPDGQANTADDIIVTVG